MDPAPSQEPLLRVLHAVIRAAVRVLAVLMVIVIVLGVVDVAWVLKERLLDGEPYLVLEAGDLLDTVGAFLAVLIALEVFANIEVYLRRDVIHVRLVLATALMALARKVIVLDFAARTGLETLALGAVIVAVGLAYGLVHRYAPEPEA